MLTLEVELRWVLVGVAHDLARIVRHHPPHNARLDPAPRRNPRIREPKLIRGHGHKPLPNAGVDRVTERAREAPLTPALIDPILALATVVIDRQDAGDLRTDAQPSGLAETELRGGGEDGVHADALCELVEVDVAAVPERTHQIERAVPLAFPACPGGLGELVLSWAVTPGLVADGADVEPGERRDDFKR